MTRKDLDNMPYKEAANLLQNALDEFKVEVDKINDKKQLDDLEQEIIKDMEVHEEYLKSVTYDLPEKCEFDGEKFTKNDIAKFVIYFINKMEVEWSYTLGIYELGKLWKNKDMTKMTYYEYDSTLRTLGQFRFKGLDEQKNILVINEFMKGCHEEYSKDTAMQIFNAQKHDTVMKRKEMITPLSNSKEA